MKRFIPIFVVFAFICPNTVLPSPVPEDHIMYVYWEVVGAPTVVTTTIDGGPHVFSGYLVGYSIAYNRPVSDTKIFYASVGDYNRALRYLLTLPNPVVLPRPVIAP
jgi:hypothetical protein